MCATEVFSIAQALRVCECADRAATRSGKRPPVSVAHITGIFEECLRTAAARDGVPVPEQLLRQAGAAVARRQYGLLREKGFAFTMLGGGARSTAHFTGFVGMDMHITLNWSAASELLSADPPVEPRAGLETPAAVLGERSTLCPDLDRAPR